MSKHTPGPWNVYQNGVDIIHPHPSNPTCNYQGYIVASANYSKDAETGLPTIEACANARLIAAAPDLLRTLQNMVTIFGVVNPEPIKAFVAIEQALGAIKKATNKE